jgi:hypothetical protein
MCTSWELNSHSESPLLLISLRLVVFFEAELAVSLTILPFSLFLGN